MQAVPSTPAGNVPDENMKRRRLLRFGSGSGSGSHPPAGNVPDGFVAVPQQKRQEICVQQGCPAECPQFGDENNEGCCPTQQELHYCCVNPTKPCRTCDCGVELQESGSGSGSQIPNTRRRRLLSLMRAKMQG